MYCITESGTRYFMLSPLRNALLILVELTSLVIHSVTTMMLACLQITNTLVSIFTWNQETVVDRNKQRYYHIFSEHIRFIDKPIRIGPFSCDNHHAMLTHNGFYLHNRK